MSKVERWDCIVEDDEAIMVSGGGLFVLHSDYADLEAENRTLREALSGAENIIWTRCLKDGADTETWTPEERAALKLLLARIYE